jgi:isoleucyl-tRNA synthetase
LSAFYFDIRKDTLYCDALDTSKRKSTVIFLNILLEILLKWFAPILSFTTEEIYRLIKIDSNKSIHLEKFPNIPAKWQNKKLETKWMELMKIREICNSSIEIKRASKEIGSSLEANLIINLNEKMTNLFQDVDFSELCITSDAKIKKSKSDEITVETIKAKGKKCPVCWKINENKCTRHSDQ